MLDLEVFYDVFTPTLRSRNSTREYWWLHRAAQVYSGTKEYWEQVEKAGLVVLNWARVRDWVGDGKIAFDLSLTDAGKIEVAEHFPLYKIELENQIVGLVERALSA